MNLKYILAASIVLTGCSLNCRYIVIDDDTSIDYRLKNVTAGISVDLGNESFVGGFTQGHLQHCGGIERLSATWQEMIPTEMKNEVLQASVGNGDLQFASSQEIKKIEITRNERMVSFNFWLQGASEPVKTFNVVAKVIDRPYFIK